MPKPGGQAKICVVKSSGYVGGVGLKVSEGEFQFFLRLCILSALLRVFCPPLCLHFHPKCDFWALGFCGQINPEKWRKNKDLRVDIYSCQIMEERRGGLLGFHPSGAE